MNLFGTDGIRGVANEDLTPEIAFRLGLGIGFLVAPGGKIGLGKDTRVSGDMLEAALIAGLCASGCTPVTYGVVTTPGLSYLIRAMGLSGGVMISASHNSGEFNGLKVFGPQGRKISDRLEEEISEFIMSDSGGSRRPTGDRVSRVLRAEDEISKYIEFLSHLPRVSLRGMKVVVDCANGATGRVAASVWENLGASVRAINAEGDGRSINLRCGSTHPDALAEEVVTGSCDVGFAHDGDGDRCIAVDSTGQVRDGDYILGIMAWAMKEEGRLAGDTVVGTVMSNLGLEMYLRSLGVRLLRTAVGDRYVLDEMDRGGYSLGGEQSGHVIFRDISPAGDGIMTSLLLSEVLVLKGADLKTLSSRIPRVPQVLVNVPVKDRKAVMRSENLARHVERAAATLGSSGRILVRPSGTEPVIRVMVEAFDTEAARRWASSVAEVIKSSDTGEA